MTCLVFFFSICKILEVNFLFCNCFKAGRVDCAKLTTDTIQVCCYLRYYLWRDTLPLSAGCCHYFSPDGSLHGLAGCELKRVNSKSAVML